MPVVSVTTGLDIEGAGGKRAVAPGGPLALPSGSWHPLDGRPRCMVATSHVSGTVGSSGFSGSHFGERTGVSLPLRGRTSHRHRQQCFVDARAQGHGSLPPGPAEDTGCLLPGGDATWTLSSLGANRTFLQAPRPRGSLLCRQPPRLRVSGSSPVLTTRSVPGSVLLDTAAEGVPDPQTHATEAEALGDSSTRLALQALAWERSVLAT